MPSKKTRFVPGWQQRQLNEAEIIQAQSAARVSEFYRQERERQIKEEEERIRKQEEERIKKEQRSYNTDAAYSQQQTDEEQLQNPQKQLDNISKQQYPVYSGKLPTDPIKEYLDQHSFEDQFIPGPLDPKRFDWAQRQMMRAKIDGDYTSPSRAAAKAIYDLESSLQKDYDNGKETTSQRMNRRIFENNTFGKLNKKHALTEKELVEIDSYKMLTDPLYSQKRLKEIYEDMDAQEKQELAQLNAVEKPKDYYGDAAKFTKTDATLYSIFPGIEFSKKLYELAKSSYGKSVFSDFIEMTNSSQRKVSAGQVERAQELRNLSTSSFYNLMDLEKYVDLQARINEYVQKQNAFRANANERGMSYFTQYPGLSAEEQRDYIRSIDELQKLKQKLDKSDWWNTLNNLSSWAPSPILGRVAGWIDSVIDDDLGGIRNNLLGIDDKLDDLTKLMNSQSRDKRWAYDTKKKIYDIRKQLAGFDVTAEKNQDHWRKQSEVDIQDLADWKSGDNWLGVQTKMDPYYSAQKTLLERSGFKWNDPVKMAQFGWAGVAGGSNSSWWKSIISIGSKGVGAIGGAVTSGGLSLAIQGAAIGASFEADKSAASDENNIEAADRISTKMRKNLFHEHKIDDFMEEGLSEIVRIDPSKAEQIKNLTKEEKEELIMDLFINGTWHSKDPKITKMHADAIIGANNQFYVDQPVNTADAAIGSIAAIANVEPVKYLARATKISGKVTANLIGRGLEYTGFKKGMHNAGVAIAESRIGRLTNKGVIKTIDTAQKGINAAEKIPIGAYVGALGGINAGQAISASNGFDTAESLGTEAGLAAVGAGAGLLFNKLRGTRKFIGVEDQIRKAYQNVRAFSSQIPSAWMKAAAVGKVSANIGARFGAETVSEMMQEGVQALSQRDDYDYDVQYNRPLSQRILQDMMLGSRAAYIWFNQDSPEMKSEFDVWSQMNATPLLTIFGPNSFQLVSGGIRLNHQLNTISIIQNNIDAERRGNIAELEQGRSYGVKISPQDKKEMHEMFNNFRKVAGRYEDARKKLNPSIDSDQLMEIDDKFIPGELIDEQEKDYNDIFSLANSAKGRLLGRIAGAKYGSDKYAKVISMASFRAKREAEALAALEEADANAAQILGDIDVEPFEKQQAKENSQDEKQDDTKETEEMSQYKIAKLLVHAATLMQMVNDYGKLEEITNRDNALLLRSRSRLNAIKQLLSKEGINVESQEDILSELETRSGMQSIYDAKRSQDQEDLTEITSAEQFLSVAIPALRERELREADFLMEQQMNKEFLVDPMYYVEQWNQRLTSDEQLESILEGDWITTLRDYESASQREVKDGDVYMGDKGWFITKIDGENIEKHSYDPMSGKIGEQDLGFDPIEYDKSKRMQEEITKRVERTKKANENIQTGNISAKPVEEPSETEEDEAVDEEEPIVDKFSVGDFVQTPIGRGRVLSVEDGPEDGQLYKVSFGRDSVGVYGANELQEINSPINNPQYQTGQQISTSDGNIYNIVHEKMESLDEDSNTATYVYDLLNTTTNEVLQDQTEDQILELINKAEQNTKQVKPNAAQKKVIQILQEIREKESKLVRTKDDKKRRSGHDYFIKERNTLKKFLRIHSVLDGLFKEEESKRQYKNALVAELRKLYNENVDEFVKSVYAKQKEYNDEIESKYGKDSFESEYFKIDLSYYLKGKVLQDPTIVDAIASILSDQEPGYQVVVGSIVDKIARTFFINAESLKNEPEYRMSNQAFSSIVNGLRQLQDRFNELGWVVDSYDYTWYGYTANGVPVAGETDLIAIDKKGNIHILDFKTTQDLTKFDTTLEYKTEDLDGNEVWVPVINKDLIPEGAETRISSNFIEKLATKDGVEGKRTYAQQYARQLEAYRLLIQETTGRQVTSLEIIPFAMTYDTQDGILQKIEDVSVYDPIDLTKVPQLKDDISEIDNYFETESKVVSEEEIQLEIDSLKDAISQANVLLEKIPNGKYKDLVQTLQELIQQAFSTIHKLDDLSQNSVKRADSVYVQGIIDTKDSIKSDILTTIERAQIEESSDDIFDESEDGQIEVDKDRSWINEGVEEVTDSQKSRWWHFNSLHSFSDAVKKIKGYLKNNIKSDFITNSTFIITRDDKLNEDLFTVTIKYRGMTFKSIQMNIGKNDICPEKYRNTQATLDEWYGAMGRNFLRQYYQLAKKLKPGERIIATKVTRTNGVIVYEGKDINLQNTQFFSENDPRLLELLNGDDSLVGVTDGGNVIEITTGNRNVIWSPKVDLDGNLITQKIREQVVPGNQDAESIPNGVTIFLHKFRNEEDLETDEPRVVPIVLRGKKLSGNTGKIIIKVLTDVSKSKHPKSELDNNYKLQAIKEDGSKEFITVSGLTNKKVLQILSRFGSQAEYADHEFIFEYATNENEEGKRIRVAGYQVIRITDMRKDATLNEDGRLHRPLIDLDLRKQEDVDVLEEILNNTQMQINQIGIMRANLNSDESSSAFGALRSFFEDNPDVKTIRLSSEIQIDRDDVFADKNQVGVGLSGIAWAIKHGYAGTNAVRLENPIISIHELGIEKPQVTALKDKLSRKKAEEIEEVFDKKEDPTVDIIKEEDEPIITDENPEVEEQNSSVKKAKDLLFDLDDDEMEDIAGGLSISAKARSYPISADEQKVIEKNLKRLVGNVAVKWTDNAIQVLKSGASVVGRTAVSAFELSRKLPYGTEFHEAFHRIFEILIPNNIRQYLYDVYRKKYGENLTDRQVSENFAELFKEWVLNKTNINLHLNLLKTFKEIKDYIDQLKALGDYRFAALFVAANSGLFRFIKPNAKNVEHFKQVLGGMSDMTVRTKDKDGKIISVQFDMFPEIGGRDLFNDAIEGIIYALFHSYSLDMLARNASNIKTSRESIASLYKRDEKTKDSAWFRVITGEYVTGDEKFTVDDAKMYYRLYKNSDDILSIAGKIVEESPDITAVELRKKIIQEIFNRESVATLDDLNYNQRLMNQLFAEDTWYIVEKKINDRLHKMSIDSERRFEEEYISKMDEADDSDEDENQISKDAGDHRDEFFDHDRSDDATAAIRFFLSTIPDERFATEEDVENRIVPSTKDKAGNPVMLSNSTNLLGFQQYLSMKIVSNRLLLACYDVTSVKELDERLQELALTDPIFYRIARRYHTALDNEIIKTPDGKNKISVNGKILDQSLYDQHKDEYGYYYTWSDNSKTPGQRINNAVTQINYDMEAFVTQLFNYIGVQKMDFIQVVLKQEVDEKTGQPIDGQYYSEVRSTDSDYAASIYPNAWFTRLRGGISGVFRFSPSGIKFENGGKELFQNAISTLNTIYLIFTKRGNFKLRGAVVDKNSDEGFRRIEFEFINALNVLGIDINLEALNYYLSEQFGQNVSIKKAFSQLITRESKDTSFQKFIEELKAFKSDVTEHGANKILTTDTEETVSQVIGGRRKQSVKRSGSYIYSKNAFVNWLARAVSKYNKNKYDVCTNGPEGSKQYMMAQSHTASDLTDDYKKAVVIDGIIKYSRKMKDMAAYVYNFMFEKQGEIKRPVGSIIIKQLYLNAGKKLQLRLHTHGGVRIENNYDGGVSYKKITEREDWIGKAAILKQGGIIFPTLSDKSTWFYLTGVTLPGIDYTNIKEVSVKELLHIGLHQEQHPNSDSVHILFNFANSNKQLDQLIEYAKCERAAIVKEIARNKENKKLGKKFPFIEYFNENRLRFGGLTEVVIMGQDGETDLRLLNDYGEGKTPEQCLRIADKLFFSKSQKDQRKIMALTLEQGFLENLQLLERNGLIYAEQENPVMQLVLDKDGNSTGKTKKSNRLLQYRNAGLDTTVISELKQKYLSEMVKEGDNATLSQAIRAESQAICAYVWDIYLRGIMSTEEVERLYTGSSMSFKWKHEKIKDALSGKTFDVLTDRHSDESKRLGGLGSTGDRNRLDLVDQRRTYVCTEVEDQMVPSLLAPQFEKAFLDNYIRDVYVRWKQEEIINDDNISSEDKETYIDELYDSVYGHDKKQLSEIEEEIKSSEIKDIYDIAVADAKKDSSYFSDKSNIVDGSAYITPNMAKQLLRQRGMLTSSVKQAFDILDGTYQTEDGKRLNPLTSKDAFKIISDAMLGSQKYSAFGYRTSEETGDVITHYYDKFALHVLFPQFATGFAGDVLKKMQYQKIDMLMMHSAVKTGDQDPVRCEQEMFKSEEEFKKFQFNTYKQDFEFIRRQLNTNPHEKNEGTMGTQMTKIALSNLRPNKLYKDSNGNLIRGRDLLKRIMTNINSLSNIGKEKVKEQFFTNGEFDFDKFSWFLEEQLERRDANINLLDGIEVEEVDGKRRLKVPIEAMSSASWLESIIVSKINKEVIDINIAGNAFYQRSVWAMEGHPTVLTDKDVNFKLKNINNGDNLLAVNEDGSMDAVISIDFFKDIIPESIWGNFKKSRQWLIDHDIISGIKSDGTKNNAKANTIGYRIPTQAQSSIHALRFVDVLPVLRATIILPQEFVAITGSDFDIDKLYLARLNYRVRTKKINDEIVDDVSSEYDIEKSAQKYYENDLIKSYISLLKDHGSYDKDTGEYTIGDGMQSALRSVDADTELIKAVLKKIEQGRPKQRYYAYKFGNLAFQVMTKMAFMVGKFGIGPFALNNNNQILTQLYGVRFKKDLDYINILDSLGCTRLDNPVDKNNKSILSWISGFINAHVDVAKDPYIRRLNINNYTYNVTNLLIRTGMGERTLMFTAQPIMVELARVYENASGQYMTDPTKSKTAKQRDAIKDFIVDNYKRQENSQGNDIKFIDHMMMLSSNEEENKVTEQILGSYARAIFGINQDGSYNNIFQYYDMSTGEWTTKNGSILEDILTNTEALVNPKKGFYFDNIDDKKALYRISVEDENGNYQEVELSAKHVQLYVFFIQNAFDKYARGLSDLVNSCKIDTKKQGKNYVEQQSYLDLYDNVFDPEVSLFEAEGLQRLQGKVDSEFENESYIDTKTRNAIDLYEEILKNVSFQTTPAFKQMHDRILTTLNSSPQNKKLSKKVNDAILTWIKSIFFENYINEKGRDYFENLFYGKDSVQARLIKLTNEIKRDRTGKYYKFGKYGNVSFGYGGVITNPLLKALQPDVYDESKDFLHPMFVKLENALLDDKENSNAIIRAWDQLYRDEEHYIEDEDGNKIYYVKEFARDLAVYAFLTSGDRTGTTKFFKFVPNSIRRELSYTDEIGQQISYTEYIRNVLEVFNDDQFELSRDNLEQIISQNWKDSDFVKPIQMVRFYGKKHVSVNTSFGHTTKEQVQMTVKKTSRGGITKQFSKIKKTFELYIGGVKNKKGKLVETIHMANDQQYPPFIKLRRLGTTRNDADNWVLYKFKEFKQIDEQDPNEGTFPIYELYVPSVSTIRAGSYDYLLFNFGQYSPSYPIEIQDMLNKLEVGGWTNEKEKYEHDNPKVDMLVDFIKELKKYGVSLSDDYLEDAFYAESQSRNFKVSDTSLKKAIQVIKDSINPKTKKTTSETKNKKKATPKHKVVRDNPRFMESSGSYAKRTEENAEWSDITLAVATSFNTAGERKTKQVAGKKYVSVQFNSDEDTWKEAVETIKKKMGKKSSIKLNIAGNGIYTLAKDNVSQSDVDDYIYKLIEYISNNIDIEEIRSGGQTGVDEAGIKAAQKLDIEWSVLAPNGFKFRNEKGEDISDKKKFIARFSEDQQSQPSKIEQKTSGLFDDVDLGDVADDLENITEQNEGVQGDQDNNLEESDDLEGLSDEDFDSLAEGICSPK